LVSIHETLSYTIAKKMPQSLDVALFVEGSGSGSVPDPTRLGRTTASHRRLNDIQGSANRIPAQPRQQQSGRRFCTMVDGWTVARLTVAGEVERLRLCHWHRQWVGARRVWLKFIVALSNPIPHHLEKSRIKIAPAQRFEPESWEEDGLGPARGGLIRLPSGRIALLMELAHQIKHRVVPGPHVVIDGGDVVTFSVSALVDEVVHALGLSESAVAWKADEDIRQSAAQTLAAWRARS